MMCSSPFRICVALFPFPPPLSRAQNIIKDHKWWESGTVQTRQEDGPWFVIKLIKMIKLGETVNKM